MIYIIIAAMLICYLAGLMAGWALHDYPEYPDEEWRSIK